MPYRRRARIQTARVPLLQLAIGWQGDPNPPGGAQLGFPGLEPASAQACAYLAERIGLFRCQGKHFDDALFSSEGQT